MDSTAIFVLLVIFMATLIRSIFGFGEALLAVPLLTLKLPVRVAAPLAVLVSITVAAVVVVQDWRKIHLRNRGWLVLGHLVRDSVWAVPSHTGEFAVRESRVGAGDIDVLRLFTAGEPVPGTKER